MKPGIFTMAIRWNYILSRAENTNQSNWVAGLELENSLKQPYLQEPFSEQIPLVPKNGRW